MSKREPSLRRASASNITGSPASARACMARTCSVSSGGLMVRSLLPSASSRARPLIFVYAGLTSTTRKSASRSTSESAVALKIARYCSPPRSISVTARTARILRIASHSAMFFIRLRCIAPIRPSGAPAASFSG